MPNANISILSAVKSFYQIQAVDMIKHPVEADRRHRYWSDEFKYYKDIFIDQFEQAIYDYTVLAVGGEARHAKFKASVYNPNFPCHGHNRTVAMNKMVQYNPDDIVTNALYLFKNGSWGNAYGGRLWGFIADAVAKRNEWGTKTIFIDHCIDLSHNGGCYFDKSEYGIFRVRNGQDYERFLDFKLVCSPTQLLTFYYIIGKELFKLINSGIRLHILPAICCRYDNSNTIGINRLMQYRRIDWGMKPIEFKIAKRECPDDCDGECNDCDLNEAVRKDNGYRRIKIHTYTGLEKRK